MDPIQRALERVADKANADWDELEASSKDDHTRSTVAALRQIAEIARAHGATAPWRPSSLPFRWGPLEVRQYVARGAHGEVYRAWDPRLEREVALKLLRPGVGDGEAPVAIAEGRLLARVRHPNVVTVYGADHIDGQDGIWMELVVGSTLADIVENQQVLMADEAMRVGIAVCDGLAAIHAAGLVHRDVKAQNVVADGEGRTILMDLSAGQDHGRPDHRLQGTPVYLAPELLTGGPATVASDIYAVGVMLFFIVTACYPLTASSIDNLRVRHANGEGERLSGRRDLPAAFAKAVDRALSVDPADRFQSAETMRAALESALGKSHRRLSVRALRAGAVTIGIAALASAVALTWMRNADPVRVAATSTQKVRERKLRVPQYPMGVPSRDGRFFPYVSSAGHLYVWEVATGQSRRLNAADAASGSARSASMSAAADRVAVGWRLSDGAHELRVLNADGTSLRALVGRQQAYEPVPLDWSRDDQNILCWFRQKNGTADLVLVSPETGDIRLLHSFSADQAPDAQLSPDGRFVILSSVEPEIENAGLHLLSTEMPSTPALLEGTANAAFGRWTPDGTSVLFLRWNGTTLDGWLMPIANGDVQGPPAMVMPNLGAPIALAVADNGAVYRILTTTTSDVYVVSFDPSGSSPPGPPVRVWQGSVGNRVGPAWSPDGRSIAYYTTQPAESPGINPKRTLTIQDWVSASAEPRQIHVPIRFLGGWSPRWSPDGRYVMVWGRDGESPKDFGYIRVDIATGEATKIVTVGTNTMAVSQYSPDGAQFFYLSPSRGIVGRTLATGSESVIIAADAQSAPARFAVSPDGRSIAFIRMFGDRASALDVQAFGGRRLRLARARHPDQLDLHAWTPDGQYLLYSRGAGTSPYTLWRIPAGGGEPLDMRFSTGPTVNVVSVSPDGGHIAYVDRFIDTELWITPLPSSPSRK